MSPPARPPCQMGNFSDPATVNVPCEFPSVGPTSPSGIDMIAVIILSNRAGAPGVNDRSSTRDGSGLRTPSVRLTLIWISFVEELFGGDETVGTITLRQSPAL